MLAANSGIGANEYAPRRHTYEDRQFLYISSDSVYCESTSETFPRGELPSRLPLLTERLIATNDSAGLLKELDDAFRDFPSWVWSGTPLRRVKRSAIKPRDSKPAISSRLHPKFCGFRDSSNRKHNVFFHFVDCVCITGLTASHFAEVSGSELVDLIGWANEYRRFCRENGVRCANSRGAFGGAMLRDPRFIGDSPRRKIPGFINETARKRLPGNHYDLRAEVGKQYDAVYLDLESAHHSAASNATFPNPSSLRGRGHILREDATPSKSGGYASPSQPWARFGTPKYDRCIRQHGLFHLSVDFSTVGEGTITPPWVKPGKTEASVWLYSNELGLLNEIGAKINGIIAAYTSPDTDNSLNLFGQWARQYLSELPKHRREWVKPLLLSTYGMLAKRAEAYQHSSNVSGTPVRYPTPDGWLEGYVRDVKRVRAPSTNNVIARGIIEAEVRQTVIRYARYLQGLGIEPLALYADSLILPGDKIAPLGEGWTVKSELSGVIFYNPVSFSSQELEKMPGIERQNLLRRARIRQIRATQGQGSRLPSTRFVGPSGEEWDTPEGKRIKRRVYGPAVL